MNPSREAGWALEGLARVAQIAQQTLGFYRDNSKLCAVFYDQGGRGDGYRALGDEELD
jgi:hypothetical protein